LFLRRLRRRLEQSLLALFVKFNWTSLYLPNFLRVLGNSPIRTKLAAACYVGNCHLEPLLLVLVVSDNLLVGGCVAREIGEVHVVVAVFEERMTNGFEDIGFAKVEVSAE